MMRERETYPCVPCRPLSGEWGFFLPLAASCRPPLPLFRPINGIPPKPEVAHD